MEFMNRVDKVKLTSTIAGEIFSRLCAAAVVGLLTSNKELKDGYSDQWKEDAINEALEIVNKIDSRIP